MMKNEDKIRNIQVSVATESSARVYFKSIERTPVYGRFVLLSDASEMEKKGFVRFVYNENWDNFTFANKIIKPAFTKLYSLNSIEWIKLY